MRALVQFTIRDDQLPGVEEYDEADLVAAVRARLSEVYPGAADGVEVVLEPQDVRTVVLPDDVWSALTVGAEVGLDQIAEGDCGYDEAEGWPAEHDAARARHALSLLWGERLTLDAVARITGAGRVVTGADGTSWVEPFGDAYTRVTVHEHDRFPGSCPSTAVVTQHADTADDAEVVRQEVVTSAYGLRGAVAAVRYGFTSYRSAE